MQEIFIFDLHRKFLIFEFAAKKRNILSRPGIFDGATPVQLPHHLGKLASPWWESYVIPELVRHCIVSSFDRHQG